MSSSQTAIDIVLRAGEIQLARQASGFRVDKKGAIDLVTEVDLECERMCRAVIAERFPDHDVLAEEFGAGSSTRPALALALGVRSARRHHELRARAADLLLVARARDRRPRRGRRRLRPDAGASSSPRSAARAPTSTASALRVSETVDADRRAARHRVSRTTCIRRAGDLVALFGAFLGRARAVRRLGSAALDLCYVAAGRFDAFWEQHLKPWDVAAGALIVEEAGGRVTGMDGSPFDPAAAHLVASNGRVHDEMLTVIREFRAGRAPNRTDA